jgi:hypothetical protein
MAQLGYDIVAHDGGWAIVVTPDRNSAFSTKQDAFDTAADFARKLRFVGYGMHVRPEHAEDQERSHAHTGAGRA